jgi:hypothetical protein
MTTGILALALSSSSDPAKKEFFDLEFNGEG